MTRTQKSKSLKTSPKPKPKKPLPQAPVVAVLGHVDHGKTTLLDNIRKTNFQTQETGGITQHIGATQVIYKGQPITFIDTPGHAAFAKMRQQGAQVTDLVVLVIAANDGVKPQTKESIRHIKAAGVPLIVALNKMDLPGANADMVKAQLVESDIRVEGYGGDVVCVETVATQGKGIPQLLEMILLVAKLKLSPADPQAPLKAVIIESKQDKRRGPVVSLVVKNGSLFLGDQIQTGSIAAKVKAIFSHTHKPLKQVFPGQPAEILGFKSLPQVGQIITRVGESPKSAQDFSLPSQTPQKPPLKKASPIQTDEPDQAEEEKPRIKAVIKADTLGTLQAIKANVTEEVEAVGEGVGEVSQSDVLLAQATAAKILSFRVKTSPAAAKLAEIEKVEINHYEAIYELLEDLEKQVLKLLEPTIDEEVIGEAKIKAQFEIKKIRIAGCEVTSGKIEVSGNAHLLRKNKIIGSSKIHSLKQGKKDVAVAKKGEECGIVLKPSLDFKVGDVIQYYRTVTEGKPS